MWTRLENNILAPGPGNSVVGKRAEVLSIQGLCASWVALGDRTSRDLIANAT